MIQYQKAWEQEPSVTRRADRETSREPQPVLALAALSEC
jgi:hypothetical protein